MRSFEKLRSFVMEDLRMIFFGSTVDSIIVISKLFEATKQRGNAALVVAVVTQPPRPVGRKRVLTQTPVELWAKAHGITAVSFASDSQKPWLYENENQVIDTLEPLKANLLISACYGQKIPWGVTRDARFGGLNIHPSLLPRWRGANPVPWAILAGDHQTGVTIVTLSDTFDKGNRIAQKKIPITDKDTSEILRTKLFTIGADLLVDVLPEYLAGKRKTHDASPHNEFPYARRFTRDDGFEPWEAIQKACEDAQEARRIERKFRALTPWPGVWTRIQVNNQQKRLKILRVSFVTRRLTLDLVQLEGKQPVSYAQFATSYLSPSSPS